MRGRSTGAGRARAETWAGSVCVREEEQRHSGLPSVESLILYKLEGVVDGNVCHAADHGNVDVGLALARLLASVLAIALQIGVRGLDHRHVAASAGY